MRLYAKLRRDTTPLGKARLDYFWLNKSPWSDIDAHEAFLPGVPPKKPPGANFYPEDMTREEFEAWVKTLPKAERDQAEGFFTVIHRDANRKLHAVPYNQEYRADLEKSAKLLDQAAALTDNATLKNFLTDARGGVPLQRLLRERHRVDGSGCADRHHHRAVRNLQRRYLRL